MTQDADPAVRPHSSEVLAAPPAPKAGGPLRDALRFARDVFWLLGWGIRSMGRGVSAPAGATTSLGCLASLVALLGGAAFWRRRKTDRRPIRMVPPAKRPAPRPKR